MRLLLLGLLLALTYTKIDTIHLIVSEPILPHPVIHTVPHTISHNLLSVQVMTSLSVGLLLSVNWFYYEYQRVLKEGRSGDGETKGGEGTRTKTE